MKIKGRVLLITLVLMLVGIGTASALVYHINDSAKALKEDYQEQIEVYQSEKDFKIKNDVSHLTQMEIKRMQTETQEYLTQKLGQDYQNSLNEKTDEIIATTDEKIEEIKLFIDGLINAN
ncbi:hypothetical protein [Paucisalibacillus globulus]|uniref:hypothetical protein n=1 Tax=Paucisalibacillus globulus TaxID=351095 RepID=UPI000BB7D08C|nr:hypothetical protein [Paucisalibacillus globulus]